jgi:hypothetical protein
MTLKVGHAFSAGEVAHAGAIKARHGYCTKQAFAQVCGPLHTPTHKMLPICGGVGGSGDRW